MTLPALMRLVFIACVIVCARAHRRLTTRPSCDDDYPNSTHALPMADPTISWYFQHYADCSRRAVWATFVNPRANFSFYVGVGVPTFQRFTGLRADALIIGPGLPAMLESDMAQVPAEVAADPAWGGAGVGAIYHRGPADQSTCAHLGAVMTRHSTVRNGRSWEGREGARGAGARGCVGWRNVHAVAVQPPVAGSDVAGGGTLFAGTPPPRSTQTHTHHCFCDMSTDSIMPVAPSPCAVAGSPIKGPLHRGRGRHMGLQGAVGGA